MIALLEKDILTNWKSVGLMLLMYLVFSFVRGFPADTYLIMGIFVFAFQVAFQEEKNNTLLLLKTMPLKPEQIVLSKYISTLIIACAVLSLGAADMMLIKGREMGALSEMLIGAALMLLIMGVFLMCFFKFGYAKASGICIVLFFLTYFLSMVSLPQSSPLAHLLHFFRFLKIPPERWTKSIELIAGMVGLYFLTAVFAIRFFKAREN